MMTSVHFRWRKPRYSVSALMLMRRTLRQWPMVVGIILIGIAIGASVPRTPTGPICSITAGDEIDVVSMDAVRPDDGMFIFVHQPTAIP